MIIRHQKIVDRINRRRQIEAENLRMNEADQSLKPLFWVVIALALIAFFTAPR